MPTSWQDLRSRPVLWPSSHPSGSFFASLLVLRLRFIISTIVSLENLSTSSRYQNSDGTANIAERDSQTEFRISQDNWLLAEAKYKSQQKTIEQAKLALNSVWYSYQQASPIIYAPISGTVSGLSLQIGSVINSQSIISSQFLTVNC